LKLIKDKTTVIQS